MKKIGILLFDQIELLDFAGPLEVFSVASHFMGEGQLDLKTFTFDREVTIAKSGMRFIPQEDITSAGELDLFIIPGGMGTRALMKNKGRMEVIDKVIKSAKITASVCSGALILGQLGYLKDLTVVTHKLVIGELEELDPSLTVDPSKRFIDHQNILTSGGISAGIDLCLYLVGQYIDENLMFKVRDYMEYYPGY